MNIKAETMIDDGSYDWLLKSALKARVEYKRGKRTYFFTEVGKDGHPTSHMAILNYNDEGRLLFDGKDIETELFMSFVGLIDETTDRAVDNKGWIDIEADPDNADL